MKFQDYIQHRDGDPYYRAKSLMRRNTRAWCKGVSGREHKYLYRYDYYMVNTHGNLRDSGHVSGFQWEVCEVCRKRRKLRDMFRLRKNRSYVLLTRAGFVQSIIRPGYWLDRDRTKKIFRRDVAFLIARDRPKFLKEKANGGQRTSRRK